MSRGRTSLTLVAGVALLVGTPTVWSHTRGADTVGEIPPPVASVDAPGRSAPATGAPLAGRPSPARSTSPPPATPVADVAAPVAVRLPAVGVDAAVVPVAIADDGGLEIPDDVATVGWFEPGVAPGELGTAVLAGHVDARDQGRGAFFPLRDLVPDDEAEVVHDDGRSTRWRVTARTSYPKAEVPLEDLFVRDGPSRLVLITCGGTFDRDDGSYTDNVVVHLEPLQADP